MEKIDLWGNIEESDESAVKILELLKEQAKILTEKTDNRVIAVFDVIKYRHSSTYASTNYQGLSKTLSALSLSLQNIYKSDDKIEVVDNPYLEDASSLYKERKYKFEISSSKYRYRIFTLNYTPLFPITIEVESGILDDKISTINITSFEDAKDKLFEIFTSRKVKYILHEMLKSSS